MGKAISELDSYAGPMSGTTKLPVSDGDTLQAGTVSQVLTYIVANLGDASTKNVGTAAGTVAAGDDARLSDERVPTAAGLAAKTTGATSKATPVDADEIPAADSAASFGLKKLTWANIKATLKTYFDTLYQAVLVSGTNIKTINGSSVLGSGDLAVSASPGGSAGQVQYGNAGAFAGCNLFVEDANTVAQRNGVTGQNNYIYNTVNGANYERIRVGWAANRAELRTEAGGTGSLRGMNLPGELRLMPQTGNLGEYVSFSATYRNLTVGADNGTGVVIGGGQAKVAGAGTSLTLSTSVNYSNPSTITIKAADPANNNLSGGHVVIAGQNGGNVVSNNNSGGSVYLDGGQGYGTGPSGDVVIGNTTGKLQAKQEAIFTKTIRLGNYTVATLPSASTSGAGAQAFVTDANATTPRSIVAGGGSNKVNVFSDGTNWLIAA